MKRNHIATLISSAILCTVLVGEAQSPARYSNSLKLLPSAGQTTDELTLNGTAKCNEKTIALTTGTVNNEAGSVFTRDTMNVQAFTSEFSFHFGNPNADGLMFVIQSQSPEALGDYGVELGFGGRQSGIGHSIGIKFDLYDNSGEGGNSTGLFLNGATPSTPATDLSTSGINLHSGDPFQADITYDGSMLVVALKDLVTSVVATQSYPVDIPAIVGGTVAYVGFTASTGGLTTDANITAWSYASGTTIALPTFSQAPGVLSAPTLVSISDATPGVSIYYSLDGSAPNEGSSLYTGPLSITSTQTVRAIALLNGYATTPVSATYSFVTATAAGRLLDQAAFGPTISDIRHVQQVGLEGYLSEQLNQPRTVLPQFPRDVGAPCDSGETCWGGVWWRAVATAPDQLRQRVAFALGHIFVTSTNTVGGYAMVPYYNMLLSDAFGNWRTLMQDVTLSPVMGNYLGMVNSGKAPAGQIANENFGRENLQLFNIGTVLLNDDGTIKTDPVGHSIPAYTEENVQGFARAFTGWTYAPRWGQGLQDFQSDPLDAGVYASPMVPIEALHDTESKVLLGGQQLPKGQNAALDLTDALDNIFQHPNVPPFISRQLIQQLVTSSPSPEYVSRISHVFEDDGGGVRGNLKAVVTAILLDEEARRGDLDPTFDAGHLREPLLFLADVLRALPYTPMDTSDPWGYWAVSWSSAAVGQAPMQSPSVFYYYSPNYVLPGSKRTAPEFGIENVASVSARKVLTDQLIYGAIGYMSLNLAGDSDLMGVASVPGDLADELSLLFLHSQMPAQMKQIIVDTVAPIQDLQQRVRVALNLVLTSSYYKIIH